MLIQVPIPHNRPNPLRIARTLTQTTPLPSIRSFAIITCKYNVVVGKVRRPRNELSKRAVAAQPASPGQRSRHVRFRDGAFLQPCPWPHITPGNAGWNGGLYGPVANLARNAAPVRCDCHPCWNRAVERLGSASLQAQGMGGRSTRFRAPHPSPARGALRGQCDPAVRELL